MAAQKPSITAAGRFQAHHKENRISSAPIKFSAEYAKAVDRSAPRKFTK